MLGVTESVPAIFIVLEDAVTFVTFMNICEREKSSLLYNSGQMGFTRGPSKGFGIQMASIVSAPSSSDASGAATKQVVAAPDYSTPHGTIPAKFLIRMGKAATAGYGINWTTLAIIGIFHVGALAAFFFFSWQRLAVMAVLYVLAINVGIGMCYHRLADASRLPDSQVGRVHHERLCHHVA